MDPVVVNNFKPHLYINIHHTAHVGIEEIIPLPSPVVMLNTAGEFSLNFTTATITPLSVCSSIKV